MESIEGNSAPAKVEEPTYRTEEDSITRFDKSKKRKKKRSNKGQRPQEEQQPSAPAKEEQSAPAAAPAKEGEAAPQGGQHHSERRRFGRNNFRRGKGHRNDKGEGGQHNGEQHHKE